MLLEGWVPTENAPALEHELDKQGYFFQQLEIEDGDKVPIKLRNINSVSCTSLSRRCSPCLITENLIRPRCSPRSLCCSSDFVSVTADTVYWYDRLYDPETESQSGLQTLSYLVPVLGLAAIIVGTCTGSFFGIALADVPALSKVKDYFVSSDNLMTFSIVIGLVQIIFGKTVAAFKMKAQKGVKYSIAPFAWVFVITALALAFGLPMLNLQLPETVKTVFIGIAVIGLVVAYLYNSPGKNIFLNFGTGLWNTYNMASGLLGDTLSYIRLFAIGLTGAILGGVFNQLAVDMTEGMNIVLRAVCMLLILLVGHAINIGLCTISSLVHPLRLIFVEYYKNAEFEGGGKEYRPFKKA